jgi:hypothetical protein
MKSQNKQNVSQNETISQSERNKICKLLDFYVKVPIQNAFATIFSGDCDEDIQLFKKSKSTSANDEVKCDWGWIALNDNQELSETQMIQFFKRIIGVWIKKRYFPVAFKLQEDSALCRHYVLEGKTLLDQLKRDDVVAKALDVVKQSWIVSQRIYTPPINTPISTISMVLGSDAVAQQQPLCKTISITLSPVKPSQKSRKNSDLTSKAQNAKQVTKGTSDLEPLHSLKEFLIQMKMFSKSPSMQGMTNSCRLRELIEEYRVYHKLKYNSPLSPCITSQHNVSKQLQHLGFTIKKPGNIYTLKYFNS